MFQTINRVDSFPPSLPFVQLGGEYSAHVRPDQVLSHIRRSPSPIRLDLLHTGEAVVVDGPKINTELSYEATDPELLRPRPKLVRDMSIVLPRTGHVCDGHLFAKFSSRNRAKQKSIEEMANTTGLDTSQAAMKLRLRSLAGSFRADHVEHRISESEVPTPKVIAFPPPSFSFPLCP